MNDNECIAAAALPDEICVMTAAYLREIGDDEASSFEVLVRRNGRYRAWRCDTVASLIEVISTSAFTLREPCELRFLCGREESDLPSAPDLVELLNRMGTLH
jgi:hypothetical protein